MHHYLNAANLSEYQRSVQLVPKQSTQRFDPVRPAWPLPLLFLSVWVAIAVTLPTGMAIAINLDNMHRQHSPRFRTRAVERSVDVVQCPYGRLKPAYIRQG